MVYQLFTFIMFYSDDFEKEVMKWIYTASSSWQQQAQQKERYCLLQTGNHWNIEIPIVLLSINDLYSARVEQISIGDKIQGVVHWSIPIVINLMSRGVQILSLAERNTGRK